MSPQAKIDTIFHSETNFEVDTIKFINSDDNLLFTVMRGVDNKINITIGEDAHEITDDTCVMLGKVLIRLGENKSFN